MCLVRRFGSESNVNLLSEFIKGIEMSNNTVKKGAATAIIDFQ